MLATYKDDAYPTDDAFALSLREAVIQANDTSGVETIWLPGWLFLLSIDGGGNSASEDDDEIGDLDVTETLTVQGISTTDSIIDADAILGLDAVFDIIGGGVTLTKNDLAEETA